MLISLRIHLPYLFYVLKSYDGPFKVTRKKLSHSQSEFKGNEIKVRTDYGYL